MNNYQMVAALAGNPNVGKSTIFNGLTGLRQHTGNFVYRGKFAFVIYSKVLSVVYLLFIISYFAIFNSP